MILGENGEIRDQIAVKTLFFFRDDHDFGKNKGNTRSKPFFLENTNFWESLSRAPNFEYPSLNSSLKIPK